MNKGIVFLLAVVLAVALSLSRPAGAATGMTKTEVMTCVKGDNETNCENKVKMNVGMSFGVSANLDVAYFDTVAEHGTGEPQPLEEPVRFEISKTLPKYLYSLRYLHTVPYAPYEEVRKISNSSVGIQSCIDGDSADNPSCGWTLDSSGKNIPYSQGFCSNRDLLDLKTCSPDQAWWRGEYELGEQSTLTNSFSTAHCLREGSVFFQGYEIDPPRRYYEVRTKMFKGTPTPALIGEFTLSPSEPVKFLKATTDMNHAVAARLLGEAAPPVAPPDLSNYILYVPSGPPDHPLVVDWQNNMLLVPREKVTVDGSECNKVGVSFKTFRAQAAVAAKSMAGDCLANQLYQLHASDLSLLTQDPLAEAKYLVSGKKMFKPFSPSQQRDTGLALAVGNPEMNFSTVSLDLDQAEVLSIANEALGFIKTAYVNNFESMSKKGTLVAVIGNVGKSKTSYIVSVRDCFPGIVGGAVPAQARELSPGEEIQIDFDIEASQNIASSHVCTVQLTAPSGRIFDQVVVPFDTLKQSTKYPRELQLKNNDTRK